MPVLGRRITASDGTSVNIVGVIKDFVGSRIDIASPPQWFTNDPKSLASAVLFVRSEKPMSDDRVASLRKALEPVWGPLSDRNFGRVGSELEPLLAPYQSQARLLGFLAGCCLLIATVGLMAAIANSVRTRRSELAVHLALGARRRDVRALVMREALASTLVGVVLGSLIGAGIASVVSTQLFGVSPVDLSSVLTVSAILIGLCVLSAWIPIRVASRLDPAVILRIRI
jgi:ABC-type antimicrobial peptide transport system permease subunit